MATSDGGGAAAAGPNIDKFSGAVGRPLSYMWPAGRPQTASSREEL